MVDMMHSTATFRSDYPLTDIDADELVHVDEKHPEEHVDQPPVKLFGDMTKMNNVEEEEPHHADLGPGAADDQAAPRDQHLSQDEEPHHAAPGPGEDDQPVPQDQQPSNITCNITQPATRPAAVVRLVLNPFGYDVNVPRSHLTTQVQPSHSPRPEQESLHRTLTMPESPHQEDEMAKTQLEDRKSYVHKSTCQEVEKGKTCQQGPADPPQGDNRAQQQPQGGWGVRDLL